MGDLGPYQLVYEVMWRALPKNSLTSAFVCKMWYLYWSVGFCGVCALHCIKVTEETINTIGR